jgi:endonuclease/exonuclease/phosphatase family metal-dependent hydrolase
MSSLLRTLRLALPLAVLAVGLAGLLRPAAGAAAEGGPQEYLFCFWNTENFFDDKLTGEKSDPDRTFDEWFARDREAFQLKIDNLTTVLAALNDGRGPDILALAEVESERAAELLMVALNKATRGAPPYRSAVYRDPKGGRHIATAVLTRLPVTAGKTQLLGRRQRILEVHIEVNEHPLVVLATHWSSRVSDEGGDGRARYAEVIYSRYKALAKADPKVDLLVCGDFNDNPDDDSVVKFLHATADPAKVKPGGPEPPLLSLFGKLWQENKDKAGTHYFKGKPHLFDQIVISPGLLDDQGWSCDVGSAEIQKHKFVTRRGQPLAFGMPRDKGERGVSDHFPVTVRLKVAAAP